MQRTFFLTSLVTALSAAAAAAQAPTAHAHPPVPLVEETPGLAAHAAISPAIARQTALRRIPSGRIVKAEIEKEHGRVVYSFDLKVPAKPGIEEVQVDASSGKVVSVEHESA